MYPRYDTASAWRRANRLHHRDHPLSPLPLLQGRHKPDVSFIQLTPSHIASHPPSNPRGRGSHLRTLLRQRRCLRRPRPREPTGLQDPLPCRKGQTEAPPQGNSAKRPGEAGCYTHECLVQPSLLPPHGPTGQHERPKHPLERPRFGHGINHNLERDRQCSQIGCYEVTPQPYA